jgi:very-short-patch-repair endonuclease
MPDLAAHARAMRRALTPAEAVLWRALRSPPLDAWHFRRQVAFKPLYIADFASHSARLIIEADGPSHDLTFAADAQRTAWFAARGYRTARFANDLILADGQSVWRAVCGLVAEGEPPPRRAARESPSPPGGGS